MRGTRLIVFLGALAGLLGTLMFAFGTGRVSSFVVGLLMLCGSAAFVVHLALLDRP